MLYKNKKKIMYLNTNIEEVASCNPMFVNWIAIYHPPFKMSHAAPSHSNWSVWQIPAHAIVGTLVSIVMLLMENWMCAAEWPTHHDVSWSNLSIPLVLSAGTRFHFYNQPAGLFIQWVCWSLCAWEATFKKLSRPWASEKRPLTIEEQTICSYKL